MTEWNDKIVAEFRGNEGRVGGPPENPAWYHNLHHAERNAS